MPFINLLDRAVSDPKNNTRVLDALLSAQREQRPCALATVADFKGSTPRKPGAKMYIGADGNIIGTIGGGALEHEVIKRAQVHIESGCTELIEIHLTHELGMCCGGGVSVLIEPQTYPPELLLFGAGHIASPLADIAVTAGFNVTVVDSRDDWLTGDRFPNVDRLILEDPLDVIPELNLNEERTFVVIVTHDHALDEEICAAILPRPFRYLGVIGSERKGAMFRSRLASRGIDPAETEQIKTPMGLHLGAETPGEIAVSIAAELISTWRLNNG